MSRITKISRLRHLGIFRDFGWPADLATFGRYNLIYGWNASGKTTLSRVLRDLEMKRAPSNGQATLSIDDKEVQADSFPQLDIPIRVFNRDFINENVLQTGDRELPPIFVLGKQSAEQQKKLEELKTRLAGTRAGLDSSRRHVGALGRDLDKLCIARAAVIKDTLRSSGPNPYKNYDKSHFRKRAEKMASDGDSADWLLSDAQRESLLLQLRASPKPTLPLMGYRLPNLSALLDAAAGLLAETVPSRVIESLKQDPQLSEWVQRGLELHVGRNADRCLFCEQPLPADRLAGLRLHFSEEYEKIQRRLDGKIKEIERISEASASANPPNHAQLYEDLAEPYVEAESALRAALEKARAFLETLIRKLKEKKQLTFDVVPIDVAVPEADPTVADRVNDVIQEHNRACNEFQERAHRARQSLEAESVAGSLDEYRRLKDEIATSSKLVEGAEAESAKIQANVLQLEREIVGHRRPAEELNNDLRNYLGHGELRLEAKETGYVILRNGVPAKALSEGELTAIALLYFLKSLQDRAFEMTHGIVALDDPVSSLDANALYLAFSYTRERTKGAGQLFVFTHNFAFFRQTKNWFHHIRGQGKRDVNLRPARFYMLDTVSDHGQRTASIRALDPLLEKYESEYHYLFARVHEAATNAAPTTLEDNYLIPNIARRLLESFLAFRYPNAAGELSKKLDEVPFDEAKKCRILRFLHTYSHDDAIMEPEHDPSLLAETRATLLDVLGLIKSEDAKHYSAMEKLVVGSGEDTDEEPQAADST